MEYIVKLFAVARQRAGRDAISLQLPAGATLVELRQQLAREVPALAELLPHVRFAINSEFAKETAVIPEGGEIALIPPVSGG